MRVTCSVSSGGGERRCSQNEALCRYLASFFHLFGIEETSGNTEPHLHCFFLYMCAFDKVELLN